MKPAKIAHPTRLGEALRLSVHDGYLGSFEVVNSLLRAFASAVMTKEWKDSKEFEHEVDQGSRDLAKIFLGQDKQYQPMPLWNRVGVIDTYIAKQVGVDSKDPVERVAGGIIAMLNELYSMTQKIEEEKLIQEQWQGQALDTANKYAHIFLGIPTEDRSVEEGVRPNKPVNRLPTT